jgi:hypothetical protein
MRYRLQTASTRNKAVVSHIRPLGGSKTGADDVGHTTWTLTGWRGLDLNLDFVGPPRETEREAANDVLNHLP